MVWLQGQRERAIMGCNIMLSDKPVTNLRRIEVGSPDVDSAGGEAMGHLEGDRLSCVCWPSFNVDTVVLAMGGLERKVTSIGELPAEETTGLVEKSPTGFGELGDVGDAP